MARINEEVDTNTLADIVERLFRRYHPGPKIKCEMIRRLAERHLPKTATATDIDALEGHISKEVFRRMGERAKAGMHGKLITGRSTTGQPIIIGTQHWLDGLENRNEMNHPSRQGAA